MQRLARRLDRADGSRRRRPRSSPPAPLASPHEVAVLRAGHGGPDRSGSSRSRFSGSSLFSHGRNVDLVRSMRRRKRRRTRAPPRPMPSQVADRRAQVAQRRRAGRRSSGIATSSVRCVRGRGAVEPRAPGRSSRPADRARRASLTSRVIVARVSRIAAGAVVEHRREVGAARGGDAERDVAVVDHAGRARARRGPARPSRGSCVRDEVGQVAPGSLPRSACEAAAPAPHRRVDGVDGPPSAARVAEAARRTRASIVCSARGARRASSGSSAVSSSTWFEVRLQRDTWSSALRRARRSRVEVDVDVAAEERPPAQRPAGVLAQLDAACRPRSSS